jgi:allantoin racemase
MQRIGLIRVLTTNHSSLLHAHGRALQAAFPVTVLSRCIPDQPEGVHDAETLAQAAPKVVALALEMAPKVDGIIISCAADPGLAEARAAVDVPVVGAGSAAAAAALSLGARVGVLGITPVAPGALSGILGDHLAAVETPGGIHTTTELLTPTGVYETLDAGQRLADRGADVIVEACTGLSSMGVAPELTRQCGLPVVDGVMAAAAALTSASRSGKNLRKTCR